MVNIHQTNGCEYATGDDCKVQTDSRSHTVEREGKYSSRRIFALAARRAPVAHAYLHLHHASKMDQWSNKTTLEFVRAYREHPCLWDHKHPQYNNKFRRNEAWVAIKEKLGKYRVDQLKRKKESLMAMFRVCKAKVMKSEADARFEPSWFAYSAMDEYLGRRYDTSSMNTEALFSVKTHLSDKAWVPYNRAAATDWTFYTTSVALARVAGERSDAEKYQARILKSVLTRQYCTDLKLI